MSDEKIHNTTHHHPTGGLRMSKETIGIGTVKKGESAAMKIMALMHTPPEGEGWTWNRHTACWEREVSA